MQIGKGGKRINEDFFVGIWKQRFYLGEGLLG